MNKTILYIGNFKVGLMDAQAQLVIGNSKILRELGYRVVLVGNDPTMAREQRLLDSKTIVDGFEAYNIQFSKGIWDLFRTQRIHHQITSVIARYPDLAMIISYGTPTFAIQLSYLASWCKRHRITFVATCVDLSSLAHGTTMERYIKTFDWKLREHIHQYHTDGIIAVSRYIANHHQRVMGKPVIVLPPLKDTKELLPPNIEEREVLSLVYVGVPFPIDGRTVDRQAYKDCIDLFIEMLCDVRGTTPAFRFDIYGLTKEQYLCVVREHESLLSKNSDVVCFKGPVSHEKAIEAVRNADYSVLYRCINEMTMAGFSSKLVESISCGTPLILTDTSDYSLYLQNGVHCHLLDANDTTAAKKTLISVLNMDRKVIAAMKTACYESHMFDYKNFTSEMGKFIEIVSARGKEVKRSLPISLG